MKRTINRVYAFTDREVNEVLIEHLKSRELPAPQYIGSTDSTKWFKEADGIRVEWTEEDRPEIAP